MKKLKPITKVSLLTMFALFLLFSCSSDDESGVNDLNGVPTGEIVALELRDVTLTGYDTTQAGKSKAKTNTQKWWSHLISKVTFNNNECGSDQIIGEEKGYFAFYPDGGLYVRTSKYGTPFKGGTWKWKSAKKEVVTVTISGNSFDNKVTYLNADNVVYASTQTQGDCSAYTYEQFNSPYEE